MVRRSWLALLGVAGLAMVPGRAEAQALCAVDNIGVPGLGDRPGDWWTDASLTPDDPRWTGASGHSLAYGSATAPAELRTIWHDDGSGQKWLYLSWQFFVDAGGYADDHVLYVGFKNGSDYRVIRFEFTGDGTTSTISECPDDINTCGIGYTVFEEQATPSPVTTCSTLVNASSTYMTKSSIPITWINTVRFWRTSWSDTQDRWAVQMRIPITAATDLTNGIAEGTGISYEAALEESDTDLHVARWPKDPAAIGGTAPRSLFCINRFDPPDGFMIDPSQFRPLALTTPGGPAPTGGCSGVIKLDMNKIGVLDGAGNIGYQFDTTGVTRLVARVHNGDASTPVLASSMHARFRLANWGASDPATFYDVPRVISPPPPTGSVSESENAAQINAGVDGDITLDWDLTPDQQCQYTWELRSVAGSTWSTQCQECPVGSDPGARAIGGTCGVVRSYHQCVAVDLRGGGLDFENSSMFNNLNFAKLSVSDTIAMIDARGLQPAPGQKEWEIYFVVMPRNMPGAAPAKTMTQLVAEAAAELLQRELGQGQQVPDGEGPDGERMPRETVERWRNLARVAGMTQTDDPDHKDIAADELARSIYATFDGNTAAHLVPSLEVYAYYKLHDPRKGARAQLVPLTSFTLATSHDGPLNGYAYALDGAAHLSGNVYKTRVPIGGYRRLKVEVEAVEGAKPTIGQDNDWPCGCVCGGKTCSEAYQMGNFGLAALVLAWVTRRRRPRKAAGRL
jgi:hypothetical protein